MSGNKVLLIDNYDSFTYNLYDYFLQLGTDCTVVRNDEWTKEQFLQYDFDILVFSPGPKRPQDAGLMMWLLKQFYLSKPILGICLGHQAIGEFFGAQLVKAQIPIHGKTSKIIHKEKGIYKGLKNPLNVMRYHSLIITNIEETPLISTAHTKEGEIMSIKHQHLPILGIQYHPESILTEQGLQLLKNCLESINVNIMNVLDVITKN